MIYLSMWIQILYCF